MTSSQAAPPPEMAVSFPSDVGVERRQISDSLEIRRGCDRKAFVSGNYATLPGWSYHDFWWVSHDDHGVYMGRGIHGQAVYVDPKAEMVIARFASNPIAGNVGIDPTALPAYRAIADHLIAHHR